MQTLCSYHLVSGRCFVNDEVAKNIMSKRLFAFQIIIIIIKWKDCYFQYWIMDTINSYREHKTSYKILLKNYSSIIDMQMLKVNI